MGKKGKRGKREHHQIEKESHIVSLPVSLDSITSPRQSYPRKSFKDLYVVAAAKVVLREKKTVDEA